MATWVLATRMDWEKLTEKGMWIQENPLKSLGIATAAFFVISSASTGIVAMYALLEIENPLVSETLASISAGLAMPALAILTWWYASKTATMAEREGQREEAKLETLRRKLLTEILNHTIYPPSDRINRVRNGIDFSTDVFDNNLELIQRLDESEKHILRQYYHLIEALQYMPELDSLDEDIIQEMLENKDGLQAQSLKEIQDRL